MLQMLHKLSKDDLTDAWRFNDNKRFAAFGQHIFWDVFSLDVEINIIMLEDQVRLQPDRLGESHPE